MVSIELLNDGKLVGAKLVVIDRYKVTLSENISILG